MTPDEELFVRVSDDLLARIKSPDWYTLLGASALLRRLLLDDEPLMHRANRVHRLKITFHVRGYAERPPPGGTDALALFLGDAVDPAVNLSPHHGPGRIVKLDGLLRNIVAVVQERRITVHDMIDFEAHVAGGVHSRSPQTQEEWAIAELSAFFSVRGNRPSLDELRAIGRVVLRGILPLRKTIQPRYEGDL